MGHEVSIARERMRHADHCRGRPGRGRDPEELEREAERVAARSGTAGRRGRRPDSGARRGDGDAEQAEAAHRAEESRLAALLRAAADRREGLARLTGQVNSLRSRAEAGAAEIGRLTAASAQAAERAEQASRAFTALETKVAGLDAGELGLDAKHEAAERVLDAVSRQQLAELRREELAADQERAALAARVEALHVGLNRKDASTALLAATDQVDGLLGSVAALVSVEAAYETAVAAAFGAAADAVAVADLDAAVGGLRPSQDRRPRPGGPAAGRGRRASEARRAGQTLANRWAIMPST